MFVVTLVYMSHTVHTLSLSTGNNRLCFWFAQVPSASQNARDNQDLKKKGLFELTVLEVSLVRQEVMEGGTRSGSSQRLGRGQREGEGSERQEEGASGNSQ